VEGIFDMDTKNGPVRKIESRNVKNVKNLERVKRTRSFLAAAVPLFSISCVLKLKAIFECQEFEEA